MDLIDIARLDEARHARALVENALETRPFGGGIAARGTPGSWINCVIGAGLAGPVPQSELKSLVEWYESVGSETRLDLSQFADSGLLADCAAMGFVLRGFEVKFFRELAKGERVTPMWPTPPDLEVSIVNPDDLTAVREHAVVASSGFYPDGTAPSEADLQIMMGFSRHPRTVCLTASIGGNVAGAGSCEIVDGEVAALFGVSVLPEFRRRGIQQALLAARLNLAAERGCRVSTIGSKPAAATERNVRRMGFQAAYSTAVLAKPGAGLVAAMG